MVLKFNIFDYFFSQICESSELLSAKYCTSVESVIKLIAFLFAHGQGQEQKVILKFPSVESSGRFCSDRVRKRGRQIPIQLFLHGSPHQERS